MTKNILASNTNYYECLSDEDKILYYNNEYSNNVFCLIGEEDTIEEVDDKAEYHEEGYTIWQLFRGEVNIRGVIEE